MKKIKKERSKSTSTILSHLLVLVLVISCKDISRTRSSPLNPSLNERPNVILIVADDQGWGDLSYSGNSNIHTPHIDAIAENGVAFDNFFVQPVCSPTRAELLTGRHHTKLGVYATSSGGERMNLGETTVADIFKKEGYDTAIYGKWHNGMQAPYHPNYRGFNDFYGFASGHWGNYFSPMLEHNEKLVQGNGYLTDDLTDHALAFVEKNKSTPFFLYLPFNTPHSPMQVPEAYWKKQAEKTLEMHYTGKEIEDMDFTKAALAMVKNIDDNVGRLYRKLEELDLKENTLIVYLSDNGPNSWRWNGGLRGKKGSVDEGGVKTVCFMEWGNHFVKGKHIRQIASGVDLLPTLAALSGVPLQTTKPLDGANLAPLTLKDSVNWTDRTLYNHWEGQTSLRTQHYRLDTENRLYNMLNDPGQQRDIAHRYPKITDSLMAAKRDWLKNVTNSKTENRPFTVGFPGSKRTQLPARDGIPHGGIKHSNQYPNCTFFENWKSVRDSITWDTEVLQKGSYKATVYYTCKPKNTGAIIQLRFKDAAISKRIDKAFDPPLTGMENDRVPRMESYVKEFIPLELGIIDLDKGVGQLSLNALEIKGTEVADIRLLLLESVSR